MSKTHTFSILILVNFFIFFLLKSFGLQNSSFYKKSTVVLDLNM